MKYTDRKELTNQESRVYHFCVAGLSNDEIAEMLVVSKKTVESHISHITDKIGMRGRGKIGIVLHAYRQLLASVSA